MEKLGWKGVIYDAWWARFKSGQEGVVVYEGGKECETTDEAKDRIQIEYDKNASLRNTRKGYILFTQKGTNCSDIVCITQEAGGSYSLSMDNFSISECDTSGDEEGYNALLNKIRENTYESINGEPRRHVQDWANKEITSPSRNDYNPGITNSYTAIVVDNEFNVSAQGLITINEAHEEVKNISVTVYASSPVLKSITLRQSSESSELECDGGPIVYLLSKDYESSILGSHASITYQKCGIETRTENKPTSDMIWSFSALTETGIETSDSDNIARDGYIVRITVNNPNTKKIRVVGTYSTESDEKIIELP